MSGGLVRLRRDGLMAGEVEKFEPYVSNGVLDRLLLDHPLVRITSFVLRRRSFRRAERYRAIEWRGWRVMEIDGVPWITSMKMGFDEGYEIARGAE